VANFKLTKKFNHLQRVGIRMKLTRQTDHIKKISCFDWITFRFVNAIPMSLNKGMYPGFVCFDERGQNSTSFKSMEISSRFQYYVNNIFNFKSVASSTCETESKSP
jgi:hypothetical protein